MFPLPLLPHWYLIYEIIYMVLHMYCKVRSEVVLTAMPAGFIGFDWPATSTICVTQPQPLSL